MFFSQDIAVKAAYDVIVCGAGPSGCTATLSAAREGLSVLLIESTSQLGGMAVSGHVSHWLGGRTQEGKWVVGGLFKKIAMETAERGYSVIPYLDNKDEYHPYGWFNWFIHGIPLDPYSVDYYLDTKMQDAEVDVLFNTDFVSVKMDGECITHVILHNCEGLFAVGAKAVIDSTGNAEVAFRCGCRTVKGTDGKLAPASLIFHVYNVDTARLTCAIKQNRDPKFRDLIKELRNKNIWKFPYDIFICTKLPAEGEYYVNTDRITGIDPTDSASLSSGYRKGRQEIHELIDIFRKYFPGFENVRLKSVAPLMGIRESRRICGDFVMTEEDLIESRRFEDTIGFSMYGWDLPDPEKPSVQPFASDTKKGYVPKKEKSLYTPLPYRIMIPQGVKNLICPGKSVSVQGQVLGPVRVMAPCMAMGEAAGTASAEVVKKSMAYKDVDIHLLKGKLREYGCIVDYEALPEIHPRKDQI